MIHRILYLEKVLKDLKIVHILTLCRDILLFKKEDWKEEGFFSHSGLFNTFKESG